MASDFISNNKKGKNSKIAGDDRNLVLVDKDFEEADFEDKVWLFWRRHGKKVVAAGVAVFLVCFAGIVWTQSRQIHVDGLQADYAALSDDEARLAFAREHIEDPMAGTIFMQQAARLASAKDFVAAAENYESASQVFAAGDALVRDRARFAAAECFYRAGQAEKAESILKSLAGTLETEETVRGQAMWTLALLAYSKGDIEGTKAQLAEMDRALGQTNIYREQMRSLKESDAQLR
ncbi:MAG: hypothetical protein K6B46_03950 [Opitutales bacterium]|nr:hypothetical protein [Opitutales bacterium]